jgi:organic radical activating enzyme
MKKICVLPFMHTVILPNGDINLCCNSDCGRELPNVSNEGLDDIINNPLHKQIRKEMMEGKQPEICRRCWDNEKIGIKSYRQQQNFTYPHYFLRLLDTERDGTIKKGVKYFDVRFNNICNLKCVMCSSSYSTSWIDDEKKLINIINNPTLNQELVYKITNYDKESFKWGKDEQIVENILNNISSLERIHFAGGEPLIAKQHSVLLEQLISRGVAKKIFLSYNSNAEFIDQKLLDMWSHFKRVKILYSMDGIEEQNDYIRFPSKWNTHLKNFDLIENSNPKNVEWRIASTLGVLNIPYIPEFVEWKISQNFKNIHSNWLDGRIMHDNILESPSYLNINILPDNKKDEVKNKLTSFKVPLSYRRDYDKIINKMCNYMYNESNTNLLSDCRDYLEGLDQIRKTDFRKTFPFLADII